MRGLVNALYGVSRAAARWDADHPLDQVQVALACKARRLSAAAPIGPGIAWLFARRAPLLLTAHHLVCGDWVVALDDVVSARATVGYGVLPLTQGMMLRVSLRSGEQLQLGCLYEPKLLDDPRLAVEREPFSRGAVAAIWTARLLILALLIRNLLEG